MSRVPLVPLVFLLATVFASPAEAQAVDPLPGRYLLHPDSSAFVGCLDLCDCPIRKVPELDGSFTIEPGKAGATFTRFTVEDVEWIIGTDPPLTARGSGFFEVRLEGSEVLEHFELSLTAGEEEPRLFRSEPRVRDEGDREIVADVRPAELVCTGQVFRLRAVLDEPAPFVRADCNADGSIDVSDAVRLLLRLFAGGGAPSCVAACDANDDGRLNISDAAAILNHLFTGGAEPPAPFPGCGEGNADLSCASFPPCA